MFAVLAHCSLVPMPAEGDRIEGVGGVPGMRWAVRSEPSSLSLVSGWFVPRKKNTDRKMIVDALH